MADIDYILDLMDWNRTEEEQAEGLLASPGRI